MKIEKYVRIGMICFDFQWWKIIKARNCFKFPSILPFNYSNLFFIEEFVRIFRCGSSSLLLKIGVHLFEYTKKILVSRSNL